MIEKIDFKPGNVTFDKLSKFNDEIPLSKQKHLLDEDLLQISYSNKITMDVGWYPAFDPKGVFKILIVKARDWDNPLEVKRCKALEELTADLQIFHKLIVKKYLPSLKKK